jgi:GMP synthase (glutamine-hydrolysing)
MRNRLILIRHGDDPPDDRVSTFAYHDVPLLGICQGAQSIAHVLGAEIGPPDSGQSEFGYYEVHPTEEGRNFLPEPSFFTQSHFHQFAIPTGAMRLAYSDTFANQAFKYGPCAYGIQFHPEVTIEGFRRWQDAPWARYHLPGAQTREEQTDLMYRHDAAQARWFMNFLECLFQP